MERTFVLVKPDGVQRALVGEILGRLERRGLKLIAAKFLLPSVELAEKHYAVHEGKSFYPGLIRYITSAPVMAMVWEGPDAISQVRATMGSTRPGEATPGTVRHDLSLEMSRNLTHASDSVESAASEINLWFKPEELVEWDRAIDHWILGKN